MCSFVSVYCTPDNEVLSEHRNQDVSDSQADAMLSEGVAARRRFQGIVGMFSVSAIIDNVSIVSFLNLLKNLMMLHSPVYLHTLGCVLQTSALSISLACFENGKQMHQLAFIIIAAKVLL